MFQRFLKALCLLVLPLVLQHLVNLERQEGPESQLIRQGPKDQGFREVLKVQGGLTDPWCLHLLSHLEALVHLGLQRDHLALVVLEDQRCQPDQMDQINQ